jgi:hypothetical protein
MTVDRPLRLCLERGSADDRMVGRLYDELGAEHSFSSWLGLLALLEDARVRASSPSKTTNTQGGEVTK